MSDIAYDKVIFEDLQKQVKIKKKWNTPKNLFFQFDKYDIVMY